MCWLDFSIILGTFVYSTEVFGLLSFHLFNFSDYGLLGHYNIKEKPTKLIF